MKSAATVKALEDRVAKLENSLTAKFERTLPTEEEFKKTMSYMERFFRGFIGIVKELDRRRLPNPATASARTRPEAASRRQADMSIAA